MSTENPSAPTPPRRKKHRFLKIVGALVLIIIVISIIAAAAVGGGGDNKAEVNTPAATPPPASGSSGTKTPGPAAEEHTTFGDGDLAVPADVKRGTYRTREGSSGCDWAVLRDFKNNLNSIITNENTDAPAIATIGAAAHGFTSSGCAEWTDDLSRVTASRTTIPPGTYFVGTDIAPGTYRSAGGDGCYYARLRDFTGGLNSILANDNPSGSAIVQILASDRGFTSSGCADWKKS